MLLKGVAEALLIPPVSLMLLAMAGLLIGRRYRRARPRSGLVGLLGLLVLAMPGVGGGLVLALERNLPMTPPPDAPPQAIVILGGDLGRAGQMQTPVAVSASRSAVAGTRARRC